MTQKERILVVDDEEDILELVRYNLAGEGFEVICAETGEQALKIAGDNKPDLIILDLMLPGINGTEVAKILKSQDRTRRVPIIMLTAKGEESDVVLGLEIGADDYITKPFSPRILNARVKAVLRRQSAEPIGEDAVIRMQDLTIDPGRRKIEVRSNEIELSYTEFQILLFLSRRPGWVFTRSQIVDAVRGDNYPVTDRSVDVQIVGLRKKLGSCGSYIQTVRGVGYRFKEMT
jgi:two-component system phosphate regulon response regulator PhoB